MRTTFLFFLIAALISCSGDVQSETKIDTPTITGDKSADVTKNTTPRITYIVDLDSTYWESVTPVDFLDTLGKYQDSVIFCISAGPSESWFDPKYLSAITNCTEINKPSTYAFSIYESNLHGRDQVSTVGCQAAYLLKSYETKKYPAYLCTYHYSDCK